jgi:hypothetical protein
MNLANIIRGLLNLERKIDIKYLPSQGLFYKDDFYISIKRADSDDIKEYEEGYIKDDIGIVINKLKKLVEKNTRFSLDYNFNDVKSIDIIFLFLEIVRFTKGKALQLKYFNDETGEEDNIEFSASFFNYFIIDDDLLSRYDNNLKEFNINDYKFSLPSIGVENCLTSYLIGKSNTENSSAYNDYNYDFLFFLSGKRKLTFDEIDNLIHIFNFDMDIDEQKKVRKIIKMFQPLQKYSLRKKGKVIELNSKINLEKIWK